MPAGKGKGHVKKSRKRNKRSNNKELCFKVVRITPGFRNNANYLTHKYPFY